MKKLNIVITAILLFALLAGIGSAVPLVPQDMGLPDTIFANVTTQTCRGCHVDAPDTHHAMVGAGATTLGCMICHPWDSATSSIFIETDCKNCHKLDTAWYKNAAVNLTAIRGNRGRPHHNITKNSTWNVGVQAAYWAADRKCDLCHNGYLARYNDGHYVPLYNASMVTPMASYKINATVGGGREWGGCMSCHDADATASPQLYNPDGTHHGARFYAGYQCNDCHVAQGPRAEPAWDRNPDPNAQYYRVWFNQSYPSYTTMFNWDTSKRHFEFRNSTMTYRGDMLNGTGCEKCHSVQSLHNIQFNADVTIPGQVPMKGHIGNQSDCNGCHAGWVASVDNPFPGPKTVTLNSATPSVLTAGTATDVTLVGDNFVEAPYATTVLVDGAIVAQKSITGTQIVVTVPASLTAGGHSIQVNKGDAVLSVLSGLQMLSVVSPGTITSAKLTGGVLTIDGAGLGAGQQAVAITKADGKIVLSDSITSSTDAQIVAVSALAAVGDTVTVMTPKGAATAVITAGTVPPGITSAKLAGSVLTIDGKGFETKPKKNPQNSVTTVKGTKTFSANGITSWADGNIIATVNTQNWKVGQIVKVKTVNGAIYQATIT